MSKSIVLFPVANVKLGLRPEPILPNWVISGTPTTRSANIVRSYDWTSNIVVWECSAGSFRWHYSKDETVIVVSGEVFITDQKGVEQRLGPGDLGFFPAGTSCIWRVPEGVKKIAVLRETMWWPLGFCLKACKKLLRMMGIGGESPL